MATRVPQPFCIAPMTREEVLAALAPDAIASAEYPCKLHFEVGYRTCSHGSQRHLGRGWLACNLCGEHTYEEA